MECDRLFGNDSGGKLFCRKVPPRAPPQNLLAYQRLPLVAALLKGVGGVQQARRILMSNPQYKIGPRNLLGLLKHLLVILCFVAAAFVAIVVAEKFLGTGTSTFGWTWVLYLVGGLVIFVILSRRKP